jgi:hypothetical protein
MGNQGGLLQLVALGKQDVFLTGNPQMTWFKLVYRRYTNFAMESQAMYFDGTPDFGKRVTCLVPKRGDLLGQLLLEVSLPALELTTGQKVGYVNSIGHALIQEISIEIGEQEIDRQNGEWMEIWSNYTTTADKQTGFYNMIGKVDGYNPNTLQGPLKLYIPLRFWFCKNPGLALPLLALQYHPIRINMTLRPLNQLYYTPLLTTPACTLLDIKPAKIESLMLWGDYIYLDVEERRRFVSNTHEYLIEQIQYTAPLPIAPGATSATLAMEFNHPIREIFWYIQRDDMTRYHEYFNYSSVGSSEQGIRQDMLEDAVLQFDGFDRFERRDAGYFRLVQPWQHHTVIPEEFYMYSYSFAIRPEDVQPSGSFNASRLDSIILQIDLNPDVVTPPKVSRATLVVGPFSLGATKLSFRIGGTPTIGAAISGPGIAEGSLISYYDGKGTITLNNPTIAAGGSGVPAVNVSIQQIAISSDRSFIVGSFTSGVSSIVYNSGDIPDIGSAIIGAGLAPSTFITSFNSVNNSVGLNISTIGPNLSTTVFTELTTTTGSFTVSAYVSTISTLRYVSGTEPVVGASISGLGSAFSTIAASTVITYFDASGNIGINTSTLGAAGVALVPEVPVTLTETQSQTCITGTLHSRIYAINHNVFRIADGFGGVLFTI